jgi:hypothetical protein
MAKPPRTRIAITSPVTETINTSSAQRTARAVAGSALRWIVTTRAMTKTSAMSRQ